MRKSGLSTVANTATLRLCAILARIRTCTVLSTTVGCIFGGISLLPLLIEGGSFLDFAATWLLVWMLAIMLAYGLKAWLTPLTKSAKGHENIWKYRRRLVQDIRDSRYEERIYASIIREGLPDLAKWIRGTFRRRASIVC